MIIIKGQSGEIFDYEGVIPVIDQANNAIIGITNSGKDVVVARYNSSERVEEVMAEIEDRIRNIECARLYGSNDTFIEEIGYDLNENMIFTMPKE